MSKGLAIYQPTGKAREYAEWACNLYVGCSNDCSYCYCKRGVLGSVIGGPQATLKKCFRDRQDAFNAFARELDRNVDALREHGLFFTFTSDPCLPDTVNMHLSCVIYAVEHGVPVQLLTKRADWVLEPAERDTESKFDTLVKVTDASLLAVGFTLTGRDDLEPGASPTDERIAAMRKIHRSGVRTFASLEPVIDPAATLGCFRRTLGFCDLYKVGLQSGRPLSSYDGAAVEAMCREMSESGERVYLKRSITDYLGLPPDMPRNIFELF